MSRGRVLRIFTAPHAGAPMVRHERIVAIPGQGLQGDRYEKGEGSWNRGKQGRRQVTLMNARFVEDSPFEYETVRRNIITDGIELMELIGKPFRIGRAIFRGERYCTPCDRPGELAIKPQSFAEVFHDTGGLIATVEEAGEICEGDELYVISDAKSS